jgi:hypothetical protein
MSKQRVVVPLDRYGWIGGVTHEDGRWFVTNGHVLVDAAYAELSREQVVQLAKEGKFSTDTKQRKGPSPQSVSSMLKKSDDEATTRLAITSWDHVPMGELNNHSRTRLFLLPDNTPVFLDASYVSPFWTQTARFFQGSGPLTAVAVRMKGVLQGIIMPILLWEEDELEQLYLAGLVDRPEEPTAEAS